MRILDGRPSDRTLILLALLTAFLTGPAFPQPDPGDRVRVRLADDPAAWHSGRLLMLSASQVMIEGDGVAEYRLDQIARFQLRDRSERGMLTGALIGAAGGAGLGIWLPNAVDVPDQDKLGYALFASASGALLGAAAGSGNTGRRGLLIGGAAGVVLGTVIFGNACEQDSPALCPLLWGGGFGAIGGTVIGSAVGLLLPNWVTIEGFGARMSF